MVQEIGRKGACLGKRLFYCVTLKMPLQFIAMEKDADINKVVHQHLEMEQFFTGFAVKGKNSATEPEEQNDGANAAPAWGHLTA